MDGLLLSLATNMVIGGGRCLTELAREYVLKAMTSAYSRDQEFEADRYATRLLKRAYFDAQAGARMHQKLRGDQAVKVFGGYFESHPSIDDRIASICKCID